ncbi:hypothetical protein CSPX01_13745 [Colletotrichum filicis]|nr:hypothetical protein CSPX01_13745 [Colletotrichum filicis]
MPSRLGGPHSEPIGAFRLCGQVTSFVSVISSSILLRASSASSLVDRQDINGQQSCDETYARAESPVIVQYHLAIHESAFQLLGRAEFTAHAIADLLGRYIRPPLLQGSTHQRLANAS